MQVALAPLCEQPLRHVRTKYAPDKSIVQPGEGWSSGAKWQHTGLDVRAVQNNVTIIEAAQKSGIIMAATIKLECWVLNSYVPVPRHLLQ